MLHTSSYATITHRETAFVPTFPKPITIAPEFVLKPLVLGPSDVPVVTNPATAAALADAALKRWPQLREPVRSWMRLRREQAALAADLPSSFRPGELSAGTMSSLPDKLSAAIGLRRTGRADAADALYLQAMQHAERDGVPHEIVEAASAYATWLIERGRLSEAAEIVGRTAPWAQMDFRAAVLQLRLFHAMGPARLWKQSLRDAERIAGQRPIPGELKTAKPQIPAAPTP